MACKKCGLENNIREVTTKGVYFADVGEGVEEIQQIYESGDYCEVCMQNLVTTIQQFLG
jgi:hypothetical protein